MRIIPVICTNCAAPLTVSENTQICNCQYCGTSFYIESENTAPAYGKNEQMIRNAEIAFNKLKDYKKAFEYYKEACYEKADDFRGYAGMLYSRMEMLGGELPDADTFQEMKKYYNSALTFANSMQASVINEFWYANLNRLETMRQNKISNLDSEINSIRGEITNLRNTYNYLENKKDSLVKKLYSKPVSSNNKYFVKDKRKKLLKKIFNCFLALIGLCFIATFVGVVRINIDFIKFLGISVAILVIIFIGSVVIHCVSAKFKGNRLERINKEINDIYSRSSDCSDSINNNNNRLSHLEMYRSQLVNLIYN